MTVSMPSPNAVRPEDRELVAELFNNLQVKAGRNRLRRRYYDYKPALRDLGISTPPQMQGLDVVVGWPAKAVDAMARRTVLDGFEFLDGTDIDSTGLPLIFESNRMDSTTPQAHASALIHALSYVFVTPGSDSTQPIVISVQSAERASGKWDNRTRRLTAALSVVDVDASGVASAFNLYRPNETVHYVRDGHRWDVHVWSHNLGMPVEPLVYRATLDRWAGSSRISRPVMALTDSAVRTLLRTEVSAEFYNAPQRYVLGADQDAFGGKTGWEVTLGRMLALSRDEEGQLPSIGQFQQQSMEPNISQLRMLAQMFASETSLPLRSLGIVGDNPESAEAIMEANKELELEIRHWEQSSLSPAWKRVAVLALRMAGVDSEAGLSSLATLRPRWADPTTVSRIAAADAFVKVASAVPGLGDSRVGLEMAGLSASQVDRLLAEKRRVQSRNLIAELAGLADGNGTE